MVTLTTRDGIVAAFQAQKKLHIRGGFVVGTPLSLMNRHKSKRR
jgi:hypothetical protein